MRPVALLLCALLALQPVALFAEKNKEVAFDMKYEGGNLPLNDSKVKVVIEPEQIVCVQNKEKHVIPVKSITEVSYGQDVHRRVGAAIGVGVMTLGIGALMALVKTKKHYVGFLWDDKATDGNAKKGGGVFKVGKGEYRGFLAALEGTTGLKAVNADAVGAGGTSKP